MTFSDGLLLFMRHRLLRIARRRFFPSSFVRPKSMATAPRAPVLAPASSAIAGAIERDASTTTRSGG